MELQGISKTFQTFHNNRELMHHFHHNFPVILKGNRKIRNKIDLGILSIYQMMKRPVLLVFALEHMQSRDVPIWGVGRASRHPISMLVILH